MRRGQRDDDLIDFGMGGEAVDAEFQHRPAM